MKPEKRCSNGSNDTKEKRQRTRSVFPDSFESTHYITLLADECIKKESSSSLFGLAELFYNFSGAPWRGRQRCIDRGMASNSFYIWRYRYIVYLNNLGEILIHDVSIIPILDLQR